MDEHKIYIAMTICNSTDRDKCKKCPYYTRSRCTERMLSDIIQIIARKDEKVSELQSKISELKIELSAMRGAANSFKAEAARLQTTVDAELDTVHDLGDDYERILEENSRLNAEVDELQQKVKLAREFVELSREGQKEMHQMAMKAKAEAYKEFFELFKTKAEAYTVATPPDFKPTATYKITEEKLDYILLKLTEKAGKER